MEESLISGQDLASAPDPWTLTFAPGAQTGPGCLLLLEAGGKPVLRMTLADGWLTAELYYEGHKEPLRLRAHWAADTRYHVTDRGIRVCLFADERLEDEEWPIGRIPLAGSRCTVCTGQARLAPAGAEAAPAPAPFILNIRHFRPEGHNTAAGDCMPFWHDGTLHLFYLFDRRGHRSKWGLGAHQWAHLSTQDLKVWHQHPMAIPIDEQWEGSICTGSVIYHEGIYRAFYAVRSCDGSPARLTWACSGDGVHYKKSGEFLTLSPPYEPASARDPMVFAGNDGQFHLLVTTSWLTGEPRGCLAHLVSPDLHTWQTLSPLVVLPIADQPECSDWFSWGGWYYLLYSNYGTARYFLSDSPLGPWTAPEDNIVGFPGLRVPKTAAFTGNRRIVAGFMPTGNGYGGELVLLEAFQQADGSLTFAAPSEI